MPPTSIRAARRASSGCVPSPTFFSVNKTMCAGGSSGSSRSSDSLSDKLRHRLARRDSNAIISPLLGRFERAGDGERDTLPAFGFDFELALSGLGDAIVFCAAMIV